MRGKVKLLQRRNVLSGSLGLMGSRDCPSYGVSFRPKEGVK